MFCPRCGRAVNDTSNFCGGCGLSRAEIEKYVVKTTPQPEAPKAEPAPQPETVAWESRPAEEAAKTEVVAEPAEAEFIAEAVKETEEAKAQQYSYTATNSEPVQTYTQTSYTYTEPAKEEAPKAEPAFTAPEAETVSTAPKAEKSENLSTVDFIWILLISAIPVVGFIYLIYLACQNHNTNKRSYARASLIISAFVVVISIVFGIGFMISGL